MKKTITLALVILTSVKIFGQSSSANNLFVPGKYIGWNNISSGDLLFRTNNQNRIALKDNTGFLGVGLNFTTPASLLNINGINNNIGDLFRTDGPAGLDNQWQLFTGTTQKFRIFVPASTGNVVFHTPQSGSRMLFNANNGTRMLITDNGLANVNGRIAMGNSLPAGFNPLSRLHLHQFGGNTEIRFTNDNIINGFVVGNDDIGTAYANQIIAQDFWFGTNNAERMRIIGTAGATQGFIGVNTPSPTRRFDINGKTRVRDLSSNGADVGLVTYFADGTLQNLAFNGNAGQALLGNGTWGNVGTGTITGGTNGNTVFSGTQIGWGSPLIQNTTIDKTNFGLRFIQSAANSATTLTPSGIGINIGPATIVTDAPLCVYGPIHSTETALNGGNLRSTVLYSNTNQAGNPANSPLEDGFRIITDRGFKGVNNDAAVFEKTDGNQLDPDGCFAFTNTGSDGIEELSMKIAGNGLVGIGENFPGTSTAGFAPARRLEILENNKNPAQEPQLRLTFNQQDQTNPTVTGQYAELQSTTLGDLSITTFDNTLQPSNTVDRTFTQRYTGIHTTTPGNTFEINSQYALPSTSNLQPQDPIVALPPTGWAGLRFTDLNSTSIVQANPGTGVLSVDENGDVIYVPASSGSGTAAADNGLSTDGPTASLIHLGQSYTGTPAFSGVGSLLDDREVPLNGFDLVFSGLQVPGKDRIAIGGAPFTGTDVTTYIDAKSKLSTTNGTEDGAAHFFTAYPSSPLAPASAMYYGAKGTVLAQHADTKIYGLFGQALTTGSTVKGIGVYGEALGSGINIGVYGKNLGGAAGSYAGYFDGSLYINGVGTGNSGIFYTSDQNYKTNIDSISNALSIVNQLKPKEFYFDTTNAYNIRFSSKKQFGFIAQDVETVLPNLVGEVTKPSEIDTLGNITPAVTYKTLNYQGFEAINTKAIQELSRKNDQKDSLISDLQIQINQLATLINSCCQSGARTVAPANVSQMDVELSDKDIIVLNQNVPNPFAEQTTITYSIPEKAGFAQLIFNDMKGQIIKVIDIKSKGKGQLNVFANDLSTGMYTYSLYVDGKLIDTKKMVKTE